MAAPTTTNVTIQLLLALGQLSQANQAILNYQDKTTLASIGAKSQNKLSPGQTNVTLNFATYFPALTAPKIIFIREVTSGTLNGFGIRHSNGGTIINYLAGGLHLATPNAIPTYFVDNLSGAAD